MTTTWYDLIAALQKVVGPDDALVIATVRRWVHEGRIIACGDAKGRFADRPNWGDGWGWVGD